MDNKDKIPYIPSLAKRFEISHDPISRERLTAITTMVRELRKKHPFVAGAVLFGSLAKGKKLDEQTAGKSDVDLIIFIDPDELKRNYDSFEEDRDKQRFNEWEDVDKELHENYDPRSEDEKKLELTANYISDIAKDMFQTNLPTENHPRRDIGFVVKAISLTGEHSIHEKFIQTFKHHNLEEFAANANNDFDPAHYSGVAHPWGLDIRGGLAKYRKAYLTSLQTFDSKERNLEWKVIMRIVKFYERQGNIPIGVKGQYPETYEEALKYYGVNKPPMTQVQSHIPR